MNKLLLAACLYALTACGTSKLSPEHSRERIVGLILMVERVEARAAAQPLSIQYSPPEIATASPLPQPRYSVKSPYVYK